MSVINQMLRDLDGRGKTLEPSAGSSTLHPGIQSVPYVAPLSQSPREGRRMAVPLLVLSLLALGGLLAWQQDLLPSMPVERPVATRETGQWVGQAPALAVPVSPESANATAKETPAPSAPASVALEAAVQALDVPVSLRLDAQLDHVPLRPVLASDPKPTLAPPAKSAAPSVSKPAVVVAQTAQVLPAPAASVSAPPPVAAAPAAVAPAEKSPLAVAQESTITTGQRQVAAVRDALAHAQSLWALGNQTGAVELLRDVLQSAEKSAQQPGMDSTLIAVVRELARMQLAMGRVAEAHDVLVHFESRLKAIPEIWAMRANAAQRLGQHQDSVLSYMQALQARPNEQRWLLGLAVSLAAMGQTASASEVVERALQQGPINRDIAAYLRQMGVNIK